MNVVSRVRLNEERTWGFSENEGSGQFIGLIF